MGAYNSAVITNAGQIMITQAIADKQVLTFSSVKISSYAYPEGTNIAGLTDLQDIKQSQQPSEAEIFNETMIQVSARFGNENVSEAYLIETIGIYATLGEGEETLFAVIQAATPDQMPVSSEVSPSAFVYVMQITVQQASQISVTVNPAGTATIQDVENLKRYVTNNFIGTEGDISNTTAEFEEPEILEEPNSGEKVSVIFGKLKLAVKNLKTLITLIGTTDISQIGGGTVTGAISALNSNLHYTFQSINNEYFVSQGFSIIERSGVMYVGSTMQLTKSLPEWTSITIGKINDWDKGVRTLGFPSSLYGTNSATIRLTIDQDGNVEAHTHGAVDIVNPMWLYSSNCFVI